MLERPWTAVICSDCRWSPLINDDQYLSWWQYKKTHCDRRVSLTWTNGTLACLSMEYTGHLFHSTVQCITLAGQVSRCRPRSRRGRMCGHPPSTLMHGTLALWQTWREIFCICIYTEIEYRRPANKVRDFLKFHLGPIWPTYYDLSRSIFYNLSQ